MYSHNMVGANDLDAAKKFYDATFQALGKDQLLGERALFRLGALEHLDDVAGGGQGGQANQGHQDHGQAGHDAGGGGEFGQGVALLLAHHQQPGVVL